MAVDHAAVELILAQLDVNRVEEVRDESWIRLSSAGACAREIGYRLTGAPRLPDSSADLVTFEVGHAVHARVQGWLTELGWLRPELVEVPLLLPSSRVRGTADGITERLSAEGFPRADGTRRVVEIKSIGNRPGEVFGREVEGAFDRLEAPRDHHVDQATAYAWAWNTLLALDYLQRWPRGMPGVNAVEQVLEGKTWPEDRVTHLTFIYVAKERVDGSPIKVFTQKVSEKRTDRLVAKFAGIWQAVDAGELPPRIKGAFGRYSPCCYCPFRETCKGGDQSGPSPEGLVDEGEGAEYETEAEEETALLSQAGMEA